MNIEAKEKLDEILALEPAALTDEDRAFLMARRSYLTEEQRQVYGLNEAPAAEAPAEEEVAEEAAEAPKKSKK